MRPSARILFVLLAAVTVPALCWREVLAACNQPNVNFLFLPGAHGGIDSPFLFASENRTVSGSGLSESDLVTLAYLPGAGATVGSALVVLKDDCTGWDDAVCSGRITPCAKTTLTKGQTPSGDPTLTFEVPDVKTGGRSRSGRVRVAVTASQVPCWMADAASSCPAGPPAGMRVCLDGITPTTTDPKTSIDSVTALPAPNDFARVCDPAPTPSPRPCKGDGQALEYAVDVHGDLLIPMDWSKVIRRHGTPADDCPPPFNQCETRDLKAWTNLPRIPGQPGPIAIPTTDNSALQSFNLDGGVFSSPPTFVVAPNPAPGRLELVGDADKPLSVLRIRRCPNGAGTCVDSAAYFNVAARVKHGGAGRIPKSGAGGGACDDTNYKPCKNDGDCADGVPCVGVGGEASGFRWKSAAAASVEAPPPPPPPSRPGMVGASQRMLPWLFTFLAIGVAWRIGRMRKA